MNKTFTSLALTVLLVLISFVTNAQTLNVSGVVVDDAELPIIGAAVLVEGTDIGTVTDENGRFSFNNLTPDAQLTASALGYASVTLKVGGGSIKFVLREDATYLDELVVVGYGVQKKSDLTGAISSINAQETMKKMPVNQVSDLLQGRVAGMSVMTSSGAAGAEQTIRVRGVNSIKADGGPLVVIDGFPGGSLGAVNPSDIKSIEILKDASSTAIYGSRGANGVILITTKSPEQDKVTVSYNGQVNFGTVQSLPEVMPVGQFAEMANDWYRTFYNKTLYKKNQITNFINGYDTFDYMGAIFNDFAVSHSHDISLMGGSQKFKYYLSLQYIDDSGIVGISNSDTWNYRVKIDSDINKYIKAGVNFSGRIRSTNSNGFSGANSILTLAQEFPMTVLPYDKDGKLTQGTISNSSVYNPIGFIDEQKRANNASNAYNNWLQAYVSVEPIKGLSIRHEQQISFSNSYSGTTSSVHSYQGKLKGVSSATYKDTNGFGWRMTTTANYMNEFAGIHRINATLGIEQSLSKSQGISLYAEDLTSEAIGWKNLMLSSMSKIQEQTMSQSTALSFFGRVNYSLLDRYMFTVTFRRDGSSLLAYDHRWDNFPSASVAWNIKEEKFMQNATFVDQLKLRYGYGISGNQAVAA